MKLIKKLKEHKLALVTFLVSIVAIIMTFFVPEVRAFLGLAEEKRDTIVFSMKPDSLNRSKAPMVGNGKEDGRLPAKRGASDKAEVYRGVVMDSLQRPLGNISVVCATCEPKQSITDKNGEFELKKRFLEDDHFKQEAVTFSNGIKTLTLHLNWREPVLINF